MLSFTPSLKLEKALKLLQGDIVLLAQKLSTMDEAEKSWGSTPKDSFFPNNIDNIKKDMIVSIYQYFQ